MVYYKAKNDYQSLYNNSKYVTIVKGELFTTTEIIKSNLPKELFEQVEINKRDVAWFFGARFEVKKEPKSEQMYNICIKQ